MIIKQGDCLETDDKRKVIVLDIDIENKTFSGSFITKVNKRISIINTWTFGGNNLSGFKELNINFN